MGKSQEQRSTTKEMRLKRSFMATSWLAEPCPTRRAKDSNFTQLSSCCWVVGKQAYSHLSSMLLQCCADLSCSVFKPLERHTLGQIASTSMPGAHERVDGWCQMHVILFGSFFQWHESIFQCCALEGSTHLKKWNKTATLTALAKASGVSKKRKC